MFRRTCRGNCGCNQCDTSVASTNFDLPMNVYRNTDIVVRPSCSSCGCTPCCCRPVPPQPPLFPLAFRVYKVDAMTNLPLANAYFVLWDNTGAQQVGITDQSGVATFYLSPNIAYTLIEQEPPEGYEVSATSWNIIADSSGTVYVGGSAMRSLTVANTPVINSGTLTLTKLNRYNNQPVAGAQFSLAGNGTTATATSDAAGQFTFANLPMGSYFLTESGIPAGYLPTQTSYDVVVAANGTISVDGANAEGYIIYNIPIYPFTFRKVDSATGLPMQSVAFRLLSEAGGNYLVTSDVNGLVDFGQLPPGNYYLTEEDVPDGYLPNTTRYSVVVTADGVITVNGVNLADFVLYNVPQPILSFIKTGGGTPVAGAQFELVSECDCDSVQAFSDSTGTVNFGRIQPGVYTLTELAPPPGYVLDPYGRTVVVYEDGTVTIGGIDLSQFTWDNAAISNSAVPFIYPVIERSVVVTGLGVPGCIIDVVFPSGNEVTVTVSETGSWIVPVPGGDILFAGDVIVATQTCYNMLPSEQVQAIVRPLE